MQINMRKEKRRITKAIYYICWEVRPGEQESAEVQGINISSSGLRFSSGVDLQPGTILFIQSQEDAMTGYATVRNCVACDGGYQTGVELSAETKKVVLPGEEDVDFYEFLQISPRADVDTIHRIYRFLASRFHPDNPDTGDSEKFVLLTRAYTVLSDRELRRNYDATRKMREPESRPVYQSVDFMDGVEGEVNRRMAVLSILYNTRRTNPHAPGVSMLKLEKQMAFPRVPGISAMTFSVPLEFVTVLCKSISRRTAMDRFINLTRRLKCSGASSMIGGGASTRSGGAIGGWRNSVPPSPRARPIIASTPSSFRKRNRLLCLDSRPRKAATAFGSGWGSCCRSVCAGDLVMAFADDPNAAISSSEYR
jgi:curved DNA-binding protein CbpA